MHNRKHPVAGKNAKFSQIYVYDNECEENELDERLGQVKENEKKQIKRETLKIIQDELGKHNPYVAKFRNAAKYSKKILRKILEWLSKLRVQWGQRKRN